MVCEGDVQLFLRAIISLWDITRPGAITIVKALILVINFLTAMNLAEDIKHETVLGDIVVALDNSEIEGREIVHYLRGPSQFSCPWLPESIDIHRGSLQTMLLKIQLKE